jgi:hypothetical protein
MALGDNTAFFNETTFYLADEQTSVTGVSGIKVSDVSTAKVLFNQLDSLNSSTITFSATIDNVDYELTVDDAYEGELIAVINPARLATQITVAAADDNSFASLTATGNNSVGPTLRRLYQLGYV